jgi:hypothetical protein
MPAWLLPDASYLVLFDGWRKPPYRPRHGKPPLPARMVHLAAGLISAIAERYLGTSPSDGLPGTARPAA